MGRSSKIEKSNRLDHAFDKDNEVETHQAFFVVLYIEEDFFCQCILSLGDVIKSISFLSGGMCSELPTLHTVIDSESDLNGEVEMRSDIIFSYAFHRRFQSIRPGRCKLH